MKAVAIRHVAFEDLGALEPVLAARGYSVTILDAGVDEIARAGAREADLLIVLGGPIGVYDVPTYPFLSGELKVIERRLASGTPLLGICLGAQLIAAATGSRVYPGSAKEIGYAPLTLTEAGQRSCLSHLGPDLHVLHWHGDTFDLPPGADRLASTAITPNQAFAIGSNALGLQFHMEADPRRIEQWLVGHASELAGAKVDVNKLRAEAARHGAPVAEAGARAFAAWLDGIAVRAETEKRGDAPLS